MSLQTVQNIIHCVHADTGPSFWGPGDRYTFLVTGAQSGGAYFIMEAIVPPGGGPPPHIHRREEESFYVLEGQLDIRVGNEVFQASAGDFAHTPRDTVHGFRNVGTDKARLLLIFSPEGLEGILRRDVGAGPGPLGAPARQHGTGREALPRRSTKIRT
ncbi:MAG: cupin domain-containing protein [Acidobacteriota bacterium]